MAISSIDPRRVELILDLGGLVYSVAVLAALLPSVRVPSLVLILYYLVVPGYSLLRLVDHPIGFFDRVALALGTSLGLLVGFVALFQTFYPTGAFNESLVIPLISLTALALSLRTVIPGRAAAG